MFAVACVALVVSNIGMAARLQRHRGELKRAGDHELEDIKFDHYVGLISWSFILIASVASLVLQFTIGHRA